MNFFRWLFSVRRRHRAGIRRYEKGGAGVRVLTLFFMLLFCGIAIGLELWSFSAGKENLLVGILVFILAVIFCIAAAEFCLNYAITAIRRFVWGVVDKAAYREQQRRLAEAAAAGGMGAEGAGAEGAGEAQPPKTHRAFDMLLFLLGLVLAIGIIIAFIVVALTLL